MSIKFLGIEIERKTDILAFAAFLLALAGILYQVFGYLQGPDVKLFPPEQILIFTEKIRADEYVMFATSMAYVNTGQPGYNAALKSESIRFTIAGKKYEQKWQEFISSGSSGNKLIKVKRDEAHPLAINAGSTISHETSFAPRSIHVRNENDKSRFKNFLKWEDFLKSITGSKELVFELVSEIYGDPHPLNIKCKIYVDDNFINLLKEKQWSAPSCWIN